MCWDTAYSTPDNTCTVVLGQSYCGIATLVAIDCLWLFTRILIPDGYADDRTGPMGFHEGT